MKGGASKLIRVAEKVKNMDNSLTVTVDEEDFSADEYVSQLLKMSGQINFLSEKRSACWVLKETSSTQLKKELFINYDALLKATGEISNVQTLIYELSTKLIEQRKMLRSISQLNMPFVEALNFAKLFSIGNRDNEMMFKYEKIPEDSKYDQVSAISPEISPRKNIKFSSTQDLTLDVTPDLLISSTENLSRTTVKEFRNNPFASANDLPLESARKNPFDTSSPVGKVEKKKFNPFETNDFEQQSVSVKNNPDSHSNNTSKNDGQSSFLSPAVFSYSPFSSHPITPIAHSLSSETLELLSPPNYRRILATKTVIKEKLIQIGFLIRDRDIETVTNHILEVETQMKEESSLTFDDYHNLKQELENKKNELIQIICNDIKHPFFSSRKRCNHVRLLMKLGEQNMAVNAYLDYYSSMTRQILLKIIQCRFENFISVDRCAKAFFSMYKVIFKEYVEITVDIKYISTIVVQIEKELAWTVETMLKFVCDNGHDLCFITRSYLTFMDNMKKEFSDIKIDFHYALLETFEREIAKNIDANIADINKKVMNDFSTLSFSHFSPDEYSYEFLVDFGVCSFQSSFVSDNSVQVILPFFSYFRYFCDLITNISKFEDISITSLIAEKVGSLIKIFAICLELPSSVSCFSKNRAIFVKTTSLFTNFILAITEKKLRFLLLDDLYLKEKDNLERFMPKFTSNKADTSINNISHT